MSGRQVLVDAEVLEKVLEETTYGSNGMQWCCLCSAEEPSHESDCPVPSLQAALTAPLQLPAGQSAGEVLRLLELVAAAAELTQEANQPQLAQRHQEIADQLDDLSAQTQTLLGSIQPAQLRALTTQQHSQPERGVMEALADQWEQAASNLEKLRAVGHFVQSGHNLSQCADELRAALARLTPAQAEAKELETLEVENQQLRQALTNCQRVSRQMLHRIEKGRGYDGMHEPNWRHILRFCEEAIGAPAPTD